MSDKQRLFVAFDVPWGHRDWLQKHAVDPLKDQLKGARWTDPQGQHVTLKFLGWVTPDVVDAIVQACRTVAAGHQPSVMTLAELGAFPNLRRARVLWAGLDDPEGVSTRLAETLATELESLGFESKNRTFTPHLTLARFKTPVRLEDLLPTVDASVLDPFTPDEITLYRSYPGRGGSRYESIEAFPLG